MIPMPRRVTSGLRRSSSAFTAGGVRPLCVPRTREGRASAVKRLQDVRTCAVAIPFLEGEVVKKLLVHELQQRAAHGGRQHREARAADVFGGEVLIGHLQQCAYGNTGGRERGGSEEAERPPPY